MCVCVCVSTLANVVVRFCVFVFPQGCREGGRGIEDEVEVERG